MKNILRKLNNIQVKLKAPKGQFNSFGKYKYRSCEDILEGIKPHLGSENCILTISDELVLIGDRYYIKATATIADCESAESVSNTAYAREELDKKGMDGSQITGTASSYARKYALNGLLCIDDTKDADTDENKNQQTNNQSKFQDKVSKQDDDVKAIENSPIEKAGLDAINAELKRTGVKALQICKAFKVNALEELNKGQFIEAMRKLEDTPKKKPIDTGL